MRAEDWHLRGHVNASARPLPAALHESVAGLDAVASVDKNGDRFIVHDNESLTVETVRTTDAFWEIFDGFQFQARAQSSALLRSHTAVLPLETARRLFDTSNPVGRSFRLKWEVEYTVVGVLAAPDDPSHVNADVYLSTDDASSVIFNPEAWDLKQLWREHLDAAYPSESHFYEDVLHVRYGPLGDLAWLLEASLSSRSSSPSPGC